ncbi:MAG: hypothetical protein AABX11_03415 [Nanoarchaeota archaeon]
MEILNSITQRILLTTLRHVVDAPTIAILKEELKMTHVGVWKALKKIEAEEMIILKSVGNKRNSIFTIYINWNNPLISKMLILALEHESTYQRRWINCFAELKDKVDFLLLYGSAINNLQKANDIDILGIVSSKNKMEVERIVMKIQNSQIKKIHFIDFTSNGLKEELKKPNVAFVNAINEGIVLFGQEKFISFIKELNK